MRLPFKTPRPRVLPFAIAFTVLSIGMRAADLVSLAVNGPSISAITPAAAETSKPADPTAAAPSTDKTGDTAKPYEGDAAKAGDKGTQLANAELPGPGLPSHPPPIVQSDTKGTVELLGTLTEKRHELDMREQALGQREALLNAAEDRINRKVEELSGMRSDLEKLLDLQKSKDEAQLASLVKIYENMKPKDAAAIFDNLELPVLVDVTGRMKEAKLAPVLAAMTPERARLLTVKLAERRRNLEGAVADAKAALGSDAPAAATGAPEAINGNPPDAAKK